MRFIRTTFAYFYLFHQERTEISLTDEIGDLDLDRDLQNFHKQSISLSRTTSNMVPYPQHYLPHQSYNIPWRTKNNDLSLAPFGRICLNQNLRHRLSIMPSECKSTIQEAQKMTAKHNTNPTWKRKSTLDVGSNLETNPKPTMLLSLKNAIVHNQPLVTTQSILNQFSTHQR